MSSLSRPVAGIGGTAVDPASPGGVIIDPTTELSGSPGLDEVIKGDGLGGWIIGPAPGSLSPSLYEFSTTGGVPGGGTRYLDHGGIAVSAVPMLLPAAATLVGITIVTDVAPGGGRTYEARVIADPGGADTLIGTALVLADPATEASTRALSAAIGVGVKWGVVLVRTVGGGASTFANARVLVEVQMP
jgi:hypothetical protein